MTLRRRVTHLGIAVLVLVVLGILAASTFSLTVGASPSGSANVGGLIGADTTWTAANSPYIVTSSVLVQQGVTLTIEPGVEVRFNAGLTLQVNGELIARGTEATPIVFTSNAPSPAPGDWGFILFTDTAVDAIYDVNGDYLSGSILEHCTIEFAGSGNDYALRLDQSGPFINQCTIKDNAGSGISVVSAGPAKILNSTIMGNTASQGGGIYIFNNGVDRVTLSGNIITGSTGQDGGAIYILASCCGTTEVEQNIISGNIASRNGGGIYIFANPNYTINVEQNTIIGNTSSGALSSAIYLRGGTGFSASLALINNNLLGNDALYLVYNAVPNTEPDVDMENNWWGTTNDADIQAAIYDWFDDPSKGFVDYTPFLTQPNTGAPVSPPWA